MRTIDAPDFRPSGVAASDRPAALDCDHSRPNLTAFRHAKDRGLDVLHRDARGIPSSFRRTGSASA